MPGSNSLSSGLRDGDGNSVVSVYPYGDCAYVDPGSAGTAPEDRIALPTGYAVVVVEAYGGDAWIVQGDATVTAPAPANGVGRGRLLAQGKEVPLPVPAGRPEFRYLAASAVTNVGVTRVLVYGVGQ